ncbi:MAG: CBS domain-containing protein [Candidatus Omnitrophota bacterium]
MELQHSESFYIRTLLNKVKIKEVMATKLITLFVDDPFSLVEEKLRRFHIRHLPVVDKAGKLVGIVTQRDLYRVQSPRKDEEGNWYYDKESLDSFILKHVMTKDPVILFPESSIAEALLLMVEKKYGCIPIVDRNHLLCGIITQVDILRIAAQILKEK